MRIVALVGITGFKGSGKDVIANFLVKEWGFIRFAFADKLREFLYKQNPWIVDIDVDHCFTTRLAHLVGTVGWERAKQIPYVRELLQVTGTEGARSIFGEDCWINALDKEIWRLGHSKIVISDCRFPNEANYIKRYGTLWRVSRPGTDPTDPHDSERFIPELPADLDINNNGTVKELEIFVHRQMNGFTYNVYDGQL